MPPPARGPPAADRGRAARRAARDGPDLLTEPATVLTDYLLAVVSTWLGAGLLRSDHPARRLWGTAMVLSAVAAVVGGTDHGFRAHFGATTRYWLWEVVYVAIGGANALLLAGAAHVVLDGRLRVYAYGALAARFVGYAYRVSRDQGFHHVVSHYALTLVLLLAFAAWGARRRERWAGWLGGAILVSIAGAAVQGLRLAPHPHFNHNDLFHVLQTVGVVFFARAAAQFPGPISRRE